VRPNVFFGGRPVVGLGIGSSGLGEPEWAVTPPSSEGPSTWAVALATSVVGAATGWALDEIADKIRGKRKHRR
jgi:hypothetical protein